MPNYAYTVLLDLFYFCCECLRKTLKLLTMSTIEVWRRLGLVSKDNPFQNISRKIKKSSKARQNQSFWYLFSCISWAAVP